MTIELDRIMDYDTLRDALDGLHAYDTGSVDSGIHDEALRARCAAYLRGLGPDEKRLLLGRLTRDLWLSDEAMAQGYGPEDASGFLYWLDGEGWLL